MNFKKVMPFFCFVISLLIYIVIFYNTLYVSNDNIFGFVILYYYLVIPLLSLICSLLLHYINASLKWAYPILIAIIGMIITIETKLFNDVWKLCVFPPFIGSFLGWLIRYMKNRNIK